MTATEPEADDLASAFVALATLFSRATTMDELGTLIVTLAVTTVDACDLAGIMTREGGEIVTLAASEQLVGELDQLQVAAGEGPCVDVLGGSPAEYLADVEAEGRWPRFVALAAPLGVRSLLAISLGGDGAAAALNLYARLPHAFGPVDRGQAAIYAAHSRLALAQQHGRDDEVATRAQLRAALATREVIGQAQGILMERERISARQAFDVLRRSSQHLNMKLRDVAQALVDTGEDPDTGKT